MNDETAAFFIFSDIWDPFFSDTVYHFIRRSWTTWHRTRRACDQRDVSLTRQLRTVVRTTYVRYCSSYDVVASVSQPEAPHAGVAGRVIMPRNWS